MSALETLLRWNFRRSLELAYEAGREDEQIYQDGGPVCDFGKAMSAGDAREIEALVELAKTELITSGHNGS